jgi:hypothetical protein
LRIRVKLGRRLSFSSCHRDAGLAAAVLLTASERVIDARQLLASGSFESFNPPIRAQLAWATSRMEIVPQARCGDRRELASKAVTGLDI